MFFMERIDEEISAFAGMTACVAGMTAFEGRIDEEITAFAGMTGACGNDVTIRGWVKNSVIPGLTRNPFSI
jgi:hypothetical protein